MRLLDRGRGPEEQASEIAGSHALDLQTACNFSGAMPQANSAYYGGADALDWHPAVKAGQRAAGVHGVWDAGGRDHVWDAGDRRRT